MNSTAASAGSSTNAGPERWTRRNSTPTRWRISCVPGVLGHYESEGCDRYLLHRPAH
ncbi:hypothetical protein ACQB60_19645 [Actinomycetota bacterium Odt1-20B]